MGSRERRERVFAETRQRILDAARETFVELGYDATTMRAIADRIEYTPTALYYHFPGKEALLTELCSADFRTLAAACRRAGRIGDPVDRLRRIGRTYVDFALDHPMQYQLMFMTRHPSGADERKDATPENPTDDAYALFRHTCADVIATGRVRPQFDDPDEVAQMVWAGLHGLLAFHIVRRDGHERIDWRDARTTAGRICDVMIAGMLNTDGHDDA